MPSSAVLNGVLAGLLGTYTSRYSDFDGYWLFGFLAGRFDRVEFDLLAQEQGIADPMATAWTLATRKFQEQLLKSGLDASRIREARMIIVQRPDDSSVRGQHFRRGLNFHFQASATGKSGRRFARETTVFVAPHDPQLERRSTRASDP